MSTRLGIFVTHPIQYFAPLWRELAADPNLSLRVHFFSDHGVRGAADPNFRVTVAWDVPLLEGYDHTFLSRNADLSKPLSIALPEARRTLREGQFDWVLIHGYTYRFEIQVARAARRLGVPVLLRGELSDAKGRQNQWYRRLLRERYLKWFYKHINRFCYIGENARRHLRRLGVPEERLFFSPYSVDSQLFEEQYRRFDREQCRRELGISSEQFVVLFSGKFIPCKEPLLLLEAVARLADKDRLTLIMLGDGEQRAESARRAMALLGNRAILPGFVNQSQLGRYFRAADLFVLPSSQFETWGLVVNEGMHFGLPAVVSSAVGCAPDLLREGETGLVFPPGSVESLAACLQKFLEAPARARAMGAAAREHIRRYSTEASVAGIKRALGLKT
ncbi:MAG TPA: glycosyltransferase family 4 protein [Gemmataceae bacterium]|jgi:glycosyltransferase involved in cell wall biosynthesis